MPGDEIGNDKMDVGVVGGQDDDEMDVEVLGGQNHKLDDFDDV